MHDRSSRGRFIGTSAVVWLVMTVILVVVPDQLERWMPLQFARVVGWVLACGVWVVVVEAEWKARFGPVMRFVAQIVLWLSAALVAIFVSDFFRG
jgi:hypothetical protein